jgi:ribulose-5-phosphate 4-epimerase/fuculose-1-phosphate aldolase
LSGCHRFDLEPARRLCGFAPADTWPAGCAAIAADASYVPNPALFSRSEAVPNPPPPPPHAPAASDTAVAVAVAVAGSGAGAGAGAVPRRSAEELSLRVELAAAYRVFAMLGWEHVIHTHITVKVPPQEGDGGLESFLINPYGLMFDEITAGSLVKVRADGTIVDPGSTQYGINPAGFKIHSAIHTSARGSGPSADITCTMHTHHRSATAIGCLKGGLLPLSTMANDLGEVSYHDFQHSTSTTTDVCAQLVRDLGPTNRVLLMRNHGDITVGRTIAETWFMMDNLHKACDIQVDAMAAAAAAGQPLVLPSAEALAENFKIVQDNYTGSPYGALEWEAIKRRLDRLHGTGYDDL